MLLTIVTIRGLTVIEGVPPPPPPPPEPPMGTVLGLVKVLPPRPGLVTAMATCPEVPEGIVPVTVR